jgi:hypothetical protein
MTEQKYRRAAPSAAAIFHRGFVGNTLKCYFSAKRDTKTGEPTGKDSLYGGIAECDTFYENPVGYSHNKLVELYRECLEEIGPEFESYVTEAYFIQNAKFVCDLIVRTGDVNKIHDTMFVSFRVDDALAEFLETKAKPTEEQYPAKLYDVTLLSEQVLGDVGNEGLSAPYNAQELISAIVLPDEINLAHKHELNALAMFFYRNLYEN